MSLQVALTGFAVLAGAICFVLAVVNERRMHRHRQPGVTYAQATMRKDGGWRNAQLFTDAGLKYQLRASRYGLFGAGLWIVGLVSWIIVQVIR